MSDQHATGATKRPRMSFESLSSRSSEKNPFQSLLREIFISLNLFLNHEDLAMLPRTCTFWRDILEDESIRQMKRHQHHPKASTVKLRTSESPWREKFLEGLLIRRTWKCPCDAVIVRTDEEASRHRGQVIAVGNDKVLTLNAQKKLKAWNSLTGDFCWERQVDSADVLLSGLILNTDFPNGRGTIISPETGETIETWDMGVLTKVAIHNERVISVSDEGDPSGGGCLRFWSPDDRNHIISVRIANFNVDHLIFDGKSVIIVYHLGGIEVWDASECSVHHFYPNRATLNSLVHDDAKIYVSFTDSEFVRVWSLGEQHETELVIFERNSSLHLSEKLLIGVSPNNRVKVWDKNDMKCCHILDLGPTIVGVTVQSTQLITHSAGRTFNICNIYAETLESHNLDLGLPEGYSVHDIRTSESSLVVDVRRNDLLHSLLILDFSRSKTLNVDWAR